MNVLEMRDLKLSIGNTEVLRGINLSIAPGEVLGVIGESGSGKSMTALAVLQLLPTGARATGSIKLQGNELLGRPDRQMQALRGAQIGMVFQEPMTALNPLETIGDQVAETARLHKGLGLRAARQLARETLDRVGLPAPRFGLGLYPHELSGGQRQRVVIAMAILLRPALLIADEPTTALDVTTQSQILELLARLVREDGMAMMFISHDLGVVAGLADRVAILKAGEVVEQGPTVPLFRNLQHPYSRALLAASSHQPHRHAAPPATAPALLEVCSATRTYPLLRSGWFAPRRHLVAVKGVSLTIREGENLGLVGESGCGKSTLARAIMGLEPLQSGTIRLSGRDLHHARPDAATRRHLQVVFQDPYGSFNPRHRVDRLVSEPFHLLGSAAPTGVERDRRIARALEDVGLGAESRHRFIHEFSGGQRQRIAIARALIIEPRLIILDEAVSALDVSIRAQILDLLADLARNRGVSYLFISHDLSVVRAITDRVLVMKAGEIVEDGATETVFTRPRHPYTVELLAATPNVEAALKARESAR